ncbi:MAG TPA: DUF4349 domain-containing protein [Pseudonocardiaceae bacterium]
MRISRTAVVAALGVVVALGLTACGSGDGGSTSGTAREQNAAAPERASGGSAADNSGSDASPGSGSGSQGEQGTPQGQNVPASQRKVVRTAQLSMEVEDVYAAARRAYEIGARFGGYVADEQTDDRRASVELKVESAELDAALTALAEIGTKVTSRHQQATDVTEQYVDLESRVATQKASVERIRGLLANATAIAEIVQIESELTSRQAELESLERRLAALSGQAELSTVTVTLVRPGTSPTREDDEAGFLAGLTTGWKVFVASTEVLLTLVGAILPFLIALAIPAAIILWAVRRRRPAATPPAPPAPAPTA